MCRRRELDPDSSSANRLRIHAQHDRGDAALSGELTSDYVSGSASVTLSPSHLVHQWRVEPNLEVGNPGLTGRRLDSGIISQFAGRSRTLSFSVGAWPSAPACLAHQFTIRDNATSD